MKKILTILILAVFVTLGCSAKDIDNDRNIESDTPQEEEIVENVDSNVEDNTSDDDVMEKDSPSELSVNFTSYENKAVGYKILIPEKWYWQHFMKSQIKAAGGNDSVDDYLVTDKNPLVGLGSEYLGQIVVEKSSFSLDDLSADKKDFSSREVTVAGQKATRYEMQTNGDHALFPNRKLIEYHLSRNDATFRLIYISNDNMENETIFEKMVESFSFSN